VLWVDFVLLVDADKKVLAALDVRALAVLLEAAAPTSHREIKNRSFTL
jgi:hypothetical protein